MSSYRKTTINVESPEESGLIKSLEARHDAEAERLKRFLKMPDLSRTQGNPINELVERLVALPRFESFDVVKVPEIVEADKSFDLFNFPPDHPARKSSDTYFLDDPAPILSADPRSAGGFGEASRHSERGRDWGGAGNHILRTHTTIMWYYWLQQSEVKSKIEKGEGVGALCHGKVYRKDEIDRNHMNVFHQMDGWYLCRKEDKVITLDDLKEVLTEIAQAVFGQDIEYRFNVDEFPYTDPSCEMEIKVGDPSTGSGQAHWIEVLGSGVVRSSVLNNLGVDPNIYNGWAFGFGLERLAIISMKLPDIRLLWSEDERVKKQLKLGNKFKEVSKFPPIIRDISFIVDKSFVPNNYFDVIRDIGGDLVEEVALLDKYENSEKFGQDKSSYTYRITYRSNERTLTTEEIDPIQKRIYDETAQQFGAELR